MMEDLDCGISKRVANNNRTRAIWGEVLAGPRYLVLVIIVRFGHGNGARSVNRRPSIVARNQFSIGHILITFNVRLPSCPHHTAHIGSIHRPKTTTTNIVLSYLYPSVIPHLGCLNDHSTSRTLMQVQPNLLPVSLQWAYYTTPRRGGCGGGMGRLMMSETERLPSPPSNVGDIFGGCPPGEDAMMMCLVVGVVVPTCLINIAEN